MKQLVLSLFPGIGLLDMAFEEEGFTVVRGPDLLWGGDIRRFHPPAGKFDGVIGGDPCQAHSQYRYLNPKSGERYGDMTPEYARIIAEARPTWFLRENVPAAPAIVADDYDVSTFVLNNRALGESQDRTRRFWWGVSKDVDGFLIDRELRRGIEFAALESLDYRQAVCSSLRAVPVKLGGGGRVKRTYSAEGKRHGPDRGPSAALAEMLRHQGLPEDFFTGEDVPFTMTGRRKMIGNGVPLPMGRAIARAVKRALNLTPAPFDGARPPGNADALRGTGEATTGREPYESEAL